MTLEFVLQSKSRAGSVVKFDDIVPSHREGLSVCGEGVIRDGMVEEMMNFRARHVEKRSDRSSSLLPLETRFLEGDRQGLVY